MPPTPRIEPGGASATTPDLAAKAAWVDAYLARYGTYEAQSSFAADAVDVLAAASLVAGSADREALRATLETLDRPRGLSGHGAPSRFLRTPAGCRLAASAGAGVARCRSLVAVVGGLCRSRRSAGIACREGSLPVIAVLAGCCCQLTSADAHQRRGVVYGQPAGAAAPAWGRP